MPRLAERIARRGGPRLPSSPISYLQRIVCLFLAGRTDLCEAALDKALTDGGPE